MKFSANLGFLWTERTLPNAIRAAAAAGFDAVECHWPYAVPAEEVNTALEETGLRMLGLNTRRGESACGEMGLAAVPGRDRKAKAAIDEAINYAASINTPNVHVMAGLAKGKDAHTTFVDNLIYACDRAALQNITILIEPLNKYDAPGYFLTTSDQAIEIIKQVGKPNLRLMFDCYHVQLMEGDVSHRLANALPFIGHIQFASVPDRGAPDHGELNYPHIFDLVEKLGYLAPLGAEYKPGSDTDATLGWLKNL